MQRCMVIKGFKAEALTSLRGLTHGVYISPPKSAPVQINCGSSAAHSAVRLKDWAEGRLFSVSRASRDSSSRFATRRISCPDRMKVILDCGIAKLKGLKHGFLWRQPF
jgi:hypothetical protein